MPYRSIYDEDEGNVYSGTRICRKCNKRQDMSEFYWGKKDRFRIRICKTCAGDRQRERKLANRDIYRHQGFTRNLRVKYGITLEQYNNLLAQQKSLCAICSKVLTRQNTHVDHDHKTGSVRGLLCFECNTAIGKFHDSIDRMRRAIAYLESEPPNIDYRSRDLTPEERKRNRSEAIARWYQTALGQEAIRRRSRQFCSSGASSAHLTELDATLIIRKYRSGKFTQLVLANEYGITQSYVGRLVRGETRFHVEERI